MALNSNLVGIAVQTPVLTAAVPEPPEWGAWRTLLLDGVEVGRAAVGAVRPMLASIETVYRPGTLTAVAYRSGSETGRSSLVSASGPAVPLPGTSVSAR